MIGKEFDQFRNQGDMQAILQRLQQGGMQQGAVNPGMPPPQQGQLSPQQGQMPPQGMDPEWLKLIMQAMQGAQGADKGFGGALPPQAPPQQGGGGYGPMGGQDYRPPPQQPGGQVPSNIDFGSTMADAYAAYNANMTAPPMPNQADRGNMGGGAQLPGAQPPMRNMQAGSPQPPPGQPQGGGTFQDMINRARQQRAGGGQ